jgi:hypothetical protein
MAPRIESARRLFDGNSPWLLTVAMFGVAGFFAVAAIAADTAAGAFSAISFHPAPAARDECVVATIASGEEAPAERLRTLAGADYWVEADHDLLLCSRGGALSAGELGAAATAAGALAVTGYPGVDRERLAFLKVTPDLHAGELGRVLARGGRWVVVELASGLPPAPRDRVRVGPALFPFEANRVLARRWSQRQHGVGEALTDPQIAAMLDEIDRDRWFADVSTLAAWNRWTRGTQVDLARDWLVAQFDALDRVAVATASFPVTYSTAWNVIATLPGTVRPDDWYVVGGHYDSTSTNPSVAAPGADDNASGCAGTLELARLFAAHPPDATIVFICFSGEEQGLYGSEDYVADLIAAGDLAKVQGAYVLDMIAFTASVELDCILETESFAQPWLNHFADAAADFTTLGIVMEYGVCCSDHAPFLWENSPAVLAIEADYPSNPNYHTLDDLPGYLSPLLAEQILRMGGGALLRLAGSTAIFVDGFESAATLRWSATAP